MGTTQMCQPTMSSAAIAANATIDHVTERMVEPVFFTPR